jgi:hypothetical protein
MHHVCSVSGRVWGVLTMRIHVTEEGLGQHRAVLLAQIVETRDKA